ncbi:MAG TPA: TAXI family TRAP transporter solute-binding subunit [Candidatus Limnocylindria bacterium]|nr:TAXI family TRAP transporter solute-binding subunit [Candidatus Limnocylindria bacterium]
MSAWDLRPRLRARAAGTLLVSAVLVLSACQPLGEGDESAGASEPAASGGGTGDAQRLSIATGGTGGVYFPLGGGLADLITNNIEGYTATAEETNASVDNMNLIGSGQSDIAFVLGDTASDAAAGTGEFEGGAIDACAIGILYTNFTQLVASADSGITSVADLEGKRVSVGEAGSGTETIGLRVLEAAGIDPDAGIQRAQLGVAETVDALRDGTLDAGFWSGGLPTGALVDYASTGDMVIVPTAEYAADLQEAYGDYYLESEIPADTYEGQSEAVQVIGVPNVLVVNTSMDEGLQEQLTALLFEHKDDLVAVHPAAGELDQETAGDVPFMDVCPGAQAFYGS